MRTIRGTTETKALLRAKQISFRASTLDGPPSVSHMLSSHCFAKDFFRHFSHFFHLPQFFFKCIHVHITLISISVCSGRTTLHIDKSYRTRFFLYFSVDNAKTSTAIFSALHFFVNMLSLTMVFMGLLLLNLNKFYSAEFRKS